MAAGASAADAGASADTITLTGLLMGDRVAPGRGAGPPKLRLCVMDVLPSKAGDNRPERDTTWLKLRRAMPSGSGQKVPYKLPYGEADRDGVRGECWVNLPPGTSVHARARRDRIIAHAKTLANREVSITAEVRSYYIPGTVPTRMTPADVFGSGEEAPDERTKGVAGYFLSFVSIETVEPN